MFLTQIVSYCVKTSKEPSLKYPRGFVCTCGCVVVLCTTLLFLSSLFLPPTLFALCHSYGVCTRKNLGRTKAGGWQFRRCGDVSVLISFYNPHPWARWPDWILRGGGLNGVHLRLISLGAGWSFLGWGQACWWKPLDQLSPMGASECSLCKVGCFLSTSTQVGAA